MILIMQGSMDHRTSGTMSTVLKANGKSSSFQNRLKPFPALLISRLRIRKCLRKNCQLKVASKLYLFHNSDRV